MYSLYQTFDGIDGKQCFRTQNCELEEYADHAVDSISIVLNAILLTAALQLGDSPFLLGMNLALALSAFYAAHWAANRTHSLVFGHVDVSEAQLSMIAIHIATAVGGPDFWSKSISGNPMLNTRALVCVASATALLCGIYGNTMIALGLRRTPLESHDIAIPRRPLSLRPLSSYGIIMLGFVLCIRSGLLVEFPVPVMFIVGLSLGKAATGLILQKLITKEELGWNTSALFPLAAKMLQFYCGNDNELLEKGIWTLVMTLIIVVVVFHVRATSDLKHARDVGIFLMRKGPEGKYPKDSGFYVCGGNLKSVQEAWKEFARDEERVRATYFTSASVRVD